MNESENLQNRGQAQRIKRVQLANRVGGLVAAGATGGIGKIARKEFQRVSNTKIQSAAEKMASKNKNKNTTAVDDKEKFNGVGFWMILAVVILNWLLDIVFDASLILSIVTIFTGMTVTFIVWFYIFLQGVSLSERKLVTWIITNLISWIPFLNIIPAMAINLIVMKYMDKSKTLKGIANVAQKI